MTLWLALTAAADGMVKVSDPEKKPVMEIFAFFLVTELQTTEVRVEIARERQGQWPYKLVCIPT